MGITFAMASAPAHRGPTQLLCAADIDLPAGQWQVPGQLVTGAAGVIRQLQGRSVGKTTTARCGDRTQRLSLPVAVSVTHKLFSMVIVRRVKRWIDLGEVNRMTKSRLFI